METAVVPSRRTAIIWGAGAAAITAVVGAIFAWLGVVNGDEGWYALSARLVSGGQLPYRDFAFTQGPVYLYVLAPFVRFWPSLYGSRAVSVLCAVFAVGLLIATARRVGGKWAAGASCAALLATIPSLPYWLSVTKTYALTSLLIASILFMVTSAIRPSLRFPLTAVLAVGLAETRTSGVVLAFLVIVAIMVMAPGARTRGHIVLASLVTSLPFVAMILLGPTSARWGLVDYHQLGTTNKADLGRYISRTFAAVYAWPGPFLLAVTAVITVFVSTDLRHRLWRRPDLAAIAVGMLSFLIVHQSGAFFFSEEYLSPLIAPMVVMSAIVFVRATKVTQLPRGVRGASAVLCTVLVAGIAVTAVTGGHNYYLGRPGWRGNPAALDQITSCVKRHSAPSDTVFALSLEEAVVQSQRRSIPGMSLGMFSYQAVSTVRAQKLKILNRELLNRIFQQYPPKVLVLTVNDFLETQRAGWFSLKPVNPATLNRAYTAYRPVCQSTLVRHVFENHRVKYTVFVR